jgi:hypothetical protein
MQENTTPLSGTGRDMPDFSPTRVFSHSSHWGAFSVRFSEGGIEVLPTTLWLEPR